MAISYTQSISSMEAILNSGSYNNIIYKINYHIEGNSGSFSDTATNDVTLDISDINDEYNFINYENTPEFEETVFTWITGSVNSSKASISSSINSQLEFSNNGETLTFSY
jgi:hypothetical protein